MAYYAGETLQKQVNSKQLSVSSAIDMAMQIAQGLAKVHAHDIVHRDIKPANIIVTNDGVAKILDFGLAKLAGSARVSAMGSTIGTLAYISPEQARGEPVDHRTDIWSLGVVLYEMLTGQLPFQGECEQEMVYAIVHEKVQPLTAWRRDAPIELGQIVQIALAKNPDERYQQVSEMIAALHALKNKLASGQATTTQAAIAVLPFADLSPQKDQEYFCDGMAQELVAALAKIEGWRVVSTTSASAFKGKEKDLRNIGERLNASHVLEGSVRKAGNRLRIAAQLISVADGFQLWSEKYDRELDDVFAIQDDIASAIVNTLKMRLVRAPDAQLVTHYTENLAAYNLYLQARFYLNKRTAEGFRKGVAYCEQALALEPAYAPAYAGLADGFALLGFQGFISPREAMPKAKAAAEKALALAANLAETHTSLGCIRAIYDWNWPESAKEFERALSIPIRPRRIIGTRSGICRSADSSSAVWRKPKRRRSSIRSHWFCTRARAGCSTLRGSSSRRLRRSSRREGWPRRRHSWRNGHSSRFTSAWF